MSNHDKFYNWLKENQNKPVEIAVHAYEFGYYATWENGFSVQVGDAIRDNISGNVINLLLDSEDYDLTFNPDKMNFVPEGDCEAGTEHFSIGFKLI